MNDSFFLIFLGKYLFKENYYENKQIEEEFLDINIENDNIVFAKIGGNYSQFNFETLINCEGMKIYYNRDASDNINNLVYKFISIQNNSISLYELINIQKKIEMKND